MAGRRKVNRGWLSLQRERYGPWYRPEPKRQIKDTGHVVPDVMKTLGMESASRLGEFTSCWEEIAGTANASHSRPGTWERGVLTVYVDHHVWLAELQRFAGKAIEQRLQKRFGNKAVRSIRFQLDPGEENG